MLLSIKTSRPTFLWLPAHSLNVINKPVQKCGYVNRYRSVSF